MTKIVPITTARKNLAKLGDRASRLLEDVIITVNGLPKFVLMSYDEYESWKETEEILSEPGIVDDLKKAEKEIDEGKYVTLEDLKRELKINV